MLHHFLKFTIELQKIKLWKHVKTMYEMQLVVHTYTILKIIKENINVLKNQKN